MIRRDTGVIRKWNTPAVAELGDTVEAFLECLGGAAWIQVPGHDRSRTRVVTTLLHGNEPSGIRAVHRWLSSEMTPVVNIACIIGAVDAALAPPGFHHRALPQAKDLNRCFREPFDGPEGRLAGTILDWLGQERPEALIDLHNTSGRSPVYGVSTRVTPANLSITSLFSEELIQTDLRLGTLMEATEDDWPTVVIECGGAGLAESDRVAYEGLLRFVSEEDIFGHESESRRVRVFQHPIRVELLDGRKVAYESSPDETVDLTLLPDVDKYNLECVQAGDMIGWVGASHGEVLSARGADGQDRTHDLFLEDGGRLMMAKSARILMMTMDPTIASHDCLFYVLPVDPARLS